MNDLLVAAVGVVVQGAFGCTPQKSGVFDQFTRPAEARCSSSIAHLRQRQTGMRPKTPKEQSMRRHQMGMPRKVPQMKAKGMTLRQAMMPKSKSQRLRTGSRRAPMKTTAIM